MARMLFITQCIPFPRQYHYSNASDNAAAHLILTQRLALFVNFVSRIVCSMFSAKQANRTSSFMYFENIIGFVVYLRFKYKYSPE